MTLNYWILLIINILIGVSGQILLKNALMENNLEMKSLFLILPKLLIDWRLITAVFCYFINLILYLILLSRLHMGFIFALQVSLGIVAVSGAGILLFNEPINLPISVGLIFIIIGIILINIR